ncbi:hypothetical protein Zm00014a_013748 [Zea mays]|uniref:Uncharacterized protein n=1 Tax=Zea mays TaxID=4577 RepID=A0A3L6EJA4_MAIZE|nr:hypothetical protein Zm00014a_013748 [Zea mays]
MACSSSASIEKINHLLLSKLPS